MHRTLIVLVGLATAPALGGCASSAIMAEKGGCKIYGGTRLDATLVSEGFAPGPELAKSKKVEGSALEWEAFSGLADMPFSFIADTFMLPVTVPLAAIKHGSGAQAAEGTSDNADADAPADSSE